MSLILFQIPLKDVQTHPTQWKEFIFRFRISDVDDPDLDLIPKHYYIEVLKLYANTIERYNYFLMTEERLRQAQSA